MPELIGETTKKTFLGIRRPTAGTAALAFVWGLFIAYNLTNGAGVIGLAREEIVAERTKDADDVKDYKAARDRKLKQREGMTTNRPAATLAQLIEAEKFKRGYIDSGACQNPRTKAQRDTCRNIEVMEAERQTALAAEKLDAEIADLDTKISAHRPTLATADPQSDLIHDATGMSKERIRLWLPASTPIILEAGGAFFWHLAFATLGWRIRGREEAPKKEPEPVFNTAPLISPERARSAPVISLEGITAQRRLAEWFFANCARPVAEGSMSEADWYEQYAAICKRSGDVPMAIESFRRVASRYVPEIGEVDGQLFYKGWLPLVPQEAK